MLTPPVTVCHFSTVHKPFDVRIFHRQACSLAAGGYKVVLITHAPFRKKFVNGILLHGIAVPKKRGQRFLRMLRFFICCKRTHARIFHFHDFELLFIGYLLKTFTGAKVVYDCHEHYPAAAFERVWYPKWIMPILSRIIFKVEPFFARRLDCVICVVCEQQRRFEANGCQTVLIRNFPKISIFEPANYLHTKKRDQIIYLGGLSIIRGALLLVDIMAELRKQFPHLRLFCLGSFNEPCVEIQVKEYAKTKAVADSIDFHPIVPHEQVPMYLFQSRVGLLPWQPNPQMDLTCSPNKVFEYWACSLPIVAGDLPGLRPLLHNSGGALLVKADQPGEYVAAISYLLKNPQRAKKIGTKGHQLVKGQYRWEVEEKKLLELYHNLSIF